MASMVPFLFRASMIQDRGGDTSRSILLTLNKFLIKASRGGYQPPRFTQWLLVQSSRDAIKFP